MTPLFPVHSKTGIIYTHLSRSNEDFPSSLPYIYFSVINTIVFGSHQFFEEIISFCVFLNTMHFMLGLGKQSQT